VDRHLLLTISDDTKALFGVRFAAQFFTRKDRIKFTLFTIGPRPMDPDLSSANIQQQIDEAEMTRAQVKRKYMDAMSRARQMLADHGYRPDQCLSKFEFSQYGKVKDIIQEAVTGKYDAVVLGRRGKGWLDQLMEESVSKGVLTEEFDFPAWICHRPELGRRNVLLCADGSQQSVRMADHAGFILNGQDHEVTLFTVKSPGQKTRPEDAQEKARQSLLENGFPEGGIKSRVVASGDITGAILKEAEDGGYAVVAVGRTGAGEGFLRRMFMGSVSMALMNRLDKAVLWVTK